MLKEGNDSGLTPQPATLTISVKFPRTEGFVIYPVEVTASVTESETWDLYGSVSRYIEHCPYAKIACLAGKAYHLRESSAGLVWPAAGMPVSYRKESFTLILEYTAGPPVDSDTRETARVMKLTDAMNKVRRLWMAWRPDIEKRDDIIVPHRIVDTLSVKQIRAHMSLIFDFAVENDTSLYELPEEVRLCFLTMSKTLNARYVMATELIQSSDELVQKIIDASLEKGFVSLDDVIEIKNPGVGCAGGNADNEKDRIYSEM